MLSASFQPFSLGFKPLLDEIATHERGLKELAENLTVMAATSMSQFGIEINYHFSNTELILERIRNAWGKCRMI